MITESSSGCLPLTTQKTAKFKSEANHFLTCAFIKKILFVIHSFSKSNKDSNIIVLSYLSYLFVFKGFPSKMPSLGPYGKSRSPSPTYCLLVMSWILILLIFTSICCLKYLLGKEGLVVQMKYFSFPPSSF